MKINKKKLQAIASIAMGKGGIKEELKAIYYHVDGEKAYLVATDAFHLVRVEVEKTLDHSVLIPRNAIDVFIKKMTAKDIFELYGNKEQGYNIGNIQFKGFEVQYPDYKIIMNTEENYAIEGLKTMTISPEILSEGLKALYTLLDGDTVTLEINDKNKPIRVMKGDVYYMIMPAKL
jgi:DNA polymerase III sliding clamp (beta) subunit (PCNA family)